MENVKTEEKVQTVEKKPYEQPAIFYQAPLEAMAIQCSPSPGKAVNPCTTVNS